MRYVNDTFIEHSPTHLNDTTFKQNLYYRKVRKISLLALTTILKVTLKKKKKKKKRTELCVSHILNNIPFAASDMIQKPPYWNANRLFQRQGSHFHFYCLKGYYGILRGQMKMYFASWVSHNIFFINRNQNGNCIFEIVYMLKENGKVGA